jgi:hypothetical protein
VLQELAGETGASGWAVASMLFFLGIWLAVAIGVWRARPETMSERARMPLDDGDAAGALPRD